MAHHWALLHMHAHGGFVSLRARFVLVLLLLLSVTASARFVNCVIEYRVLEYRSK